MKREFGGGTIEVGARGNSGEHIALLTEVEGVEVTRAAKQGERVVAKVPVWTGGYAGEYIGLENAYVRAIALALEEQPEASELVIAAPSLKATGYPGEPSAFVALSTLAREISERSPALDKLTLWVDSADLADFERVFPEWSETMLGT